LLPAYIEKRGRKDRIGRGGVERKFVKVDDTPTGIRMSLPINRKTKIFQPQTTITVVFCLQNWDLVVGPKFLYLLQKRFLGVPL